MENVNLRMDALMMFVRRKAEVQQVNEYTRQHMDRELSELELYRKE